LTLPLSLLFFGTFAMPSTTAGWIGFLGVALARGFLRTAVGALAEPLRLRRAATDISQADGSVAVAAPQ
jgi:hypothetical protein